MSEITSEHVALQETVAIFHNCHNSSIVFKILLRSWISRRIACLLCFVRPKWAVDYATHQIEMADVYHSCSSPTDDGEFLQINGRRWWKAQIRTYTPRHTHVNAHTHTHTHTHTHKHTHTCRHTRARTGINSFVSVDEKQKSIRRGKSLCCVLSNKIIRFLPVASRLFPSRHSLSLFLHFLFFLQEISYTVIPNHTLVLIMESITGRYFIPEYFKLTNQPVRCYGYPARMKNRAEGRRKFVNIFKLE